MVDYSADADTAGRRRRTYRSFEEYHTRLQERNAARSEEDWQAYARDTVYRKLAIRDHSRAELSAALQAKEVPDHLIEKTLDAFAQAGLINDEAFAQAFVRSALSSKGVSRRALAQKLAAKGVESAIIANALEALSPSEESEHARRFALRKAESMGSVDSQTLKRRLYAALSRRGYTPSQIRDAVHSALHELSEEAENS